MKESLLGPCSLLKVACEHTQVAGMQKDTGLAYRLIDVALALHAIG